MKLADYYRHEIVQKVNFNSFYNVILTLKIQNVKKYFANFETIGHEIRLYN